MGLAGDLWRSSPRFSDGLTCRWYGLEGNRENLPEGSDGHGVHVPGTRPVTGRPLTDNRTMDGRIEMVGENTGFFRGACSCF